MRKKIIFLSASFLVLCSFYEMPAQSGSSITFSEVMFYPLETNGEFIEIYNTSVTETIDLSGFKIKYYTSPPNTFTAFIGGTKLEPGRCAVILQGNYDFNNGRYRLLIPNDAVVLKLSSNSFGSSGMANTTSRDLYLINSTDDIIDTYIYSADNDAGFSDEKIILNKNNSATNWMNSLIVNGTPGFKNSAVTMPAYASGFFIINEIMFDPDTDNAEYLEFYNTTSDSIQLYGLELTAGSSAKIKLTSSGLILPPYNYYVLADDSSIYKNYYWLKNESKVGIAKSMTLSNEGSVLLIKDSHGNKLDSVFYLPDWHNKYVAFTKNKSLERINPLIDSNNKLNWNTCVNSEGGTPGRQNSIFTQNLSRESKVSISPNPFSPDGDGFEDFALINFDLTKPLSQVRIKVFDSSGRLVRTLADNRPSSSKNSILFDGLDENNRPLRIGIYLLLIETTSDGSGIVETIKTPIVIARKL